MSLNFFTMDFLEENLCDLMAEATKTKNSIVLGRHRPPRQRMKEEA